MKKDEFKQLVESRTFGRNAAMLSLTVEPKNFRAVAQFLRNEPDMQLDWVEAITAFVLDKSIVISWFLRSYAGDAQVVVRTSVPRIHAERSPAIETVADLWPMAAAHEAEVAEHFGVRFHAH